MTSTDLSSLSKGISENHYQDTLSRHPIKTPYPKTIHINMKVFENIYKHLHQEMSDTSRNQ